MKNKINHLFFAAVALVLFCSCEPNSPQTLTETLPETEVVLTPTELPKPTGTSTEAEPSLTTTTPVVPLSQEGPWLVIHSDEGAWVANADGTGLAQIINFNGYSGRLEIAFSPQDGRIAYFYPPTDPTLMVTTPPKLELITLPSLSSQTLTLLHSGKPLDRSPDIYHTDPNVNVLAALIWSNMAWSPDGSLLAFVSAQDGPSTDLYVYSAIDQNISRLTDGPTQTTNISWSPDGQYIVSAAAEDMNFATGGSNGPTVESIWAVRPDGNDLHAIHIYPGGFNGPPILVDWVNARAYVEYYSLLGCGRQNLTFVDIQKSNQYTFVPGAFSAFDLDPVTGTVLVRIPDIRDDQWYAMECGSTFEPGLYLLSIYGAEEPKVLFPSSDPSFPASWINSIIWSPEAKLFFVIAEEGVYTVDLQGQIARTEIPGTSDIFVDYYVDVSPHGREWTVFSNGNLWMDSPDFPAIQIFSGVVDDFLWTPDGSAILFMANDMLYRAAAPDYEPIKLTGSLPHQDPYLSFQINWVMP